jgi:nitrite reductase/ring-hydroxylating ferredoxin subunit
MSVRNVADAAPDPNASLNLERNPALTRVATYRRGIGASVDRVWENVLDWEHLPWLHSRTFAAIRCHEAGAWGWRAEVVYPGGLDGSDGPDGPSDDRRSQIELLTDREAGHYVTRVLTGPGADGEIWTTLSPGGKHETGIVVEFWMKLQSGADTDALGKAYLRLYEMLWDEDETMMQHRQAELDLAKDPDSISGRADAIELGTLSEIRSRLPLVLDAFGARMRIVDIDGDWILHAATCPHSRGPLDEGEIVDGEVTCPWHGYRFDLKTGRSCDGRGLRLHCPARLAVDADTDRVTLLRAGADG